MAGKDIWDMSDEELEAAFLDAKASESAGLDEIAQGQDQASMDVEEDYDNDVSDEDDTEEFDNGSEQPEDTEDSDHDDSTDEVDDEEEGSETDEDLDGDTTEDTPEKDSETEEVQPVQAYKFKANGKDYEFSSEEIVEQFPKIFGQAMDYTKKMQSIKPWRKTIDAIEGAKLNHDDVNLMIDVLKGDKSAIAEVLKRTGVDTLELDPEENAAYVAKDYGRDSDALAIKDVVDSISSDPEYRTTENILSKEWDDSSWNSFAKDPSLIRLLHEDVKSGMYATLQPTFEKLKLYDRGSKSDLDYYKQAAQQHFDKISKEDAYNSRQKELATQQAASEADQERVNKVKAQSAKRKAVSDASAKRKAAAPTKNVASGRHVVDYLEDSDEAFDDWYKKLQDS